MENITPIIIQSPSKREINEFIGPVSQDVKEYIISKIKKINSENNLNNEKKELFLYLCKLETDIYDKIKLLLEITLEFIEKNNSLIEEIKNLIKKKLITVFDLIDLSLKIKRKLNIKKFDKKFDKKMYKKGGEPFDFDLMCSFISVSFTILLFLSAYYYDNYYRIVQNENARIRRIQQAQLFEQEYMRERLQRRQRGQRGQREISVIIPDQSDLFNRSTPSIFVPYIPPNSVREIDFQTTPSVSFKIEDIYGTEPGSHEVTDPISFDIINNGDEIIIIPDYSNQKYYIFKYDSLNDYFQYTQNYINPSINQEISIEIYRGKFELVSDQPSVDGGRKKYFKLSKKKIKYYKNKKRNNKTNKK